MGQLSLKLNNFIKNQSLMLSELELEAIKDVPILKVLDQPISPAILAGILDINVSYIYQEVQKGRLPDLKDLTYLDAIRHQLKYYKNSTEAKMEKARLDHEFQLEKLRQKQQIKDKQNEIPEGDTAGLSLNSLTAKKLKQDIRLGVAKEAETWLKILQTRQKCVFIENLIPFLEPFLLSIRSSLVNLGKKHPEIQDSIDSTMEELWNLGKTLANKASLEEESFIEKVKTIEFSDDVKIEEMF